MTKKLDLKGKPCPTPVVETKKALDSIDEGIIVVEVDNEVSKNNVERFAKKSGCSVEVEEREGIYILTITKGFTCNVQLEKPEESSGDYLLYINKDVMGIGNNELGKILIKAFFKTLLDNENKPKTIIFVNSGVKLVVEGSEILNDLEKLNKNFNIEILACGTCLDYFNLKDKIKVGSISNMFDIQNALVNASKIVSP